MNSVEGIKRLAELAEATPSEAMLVELQESVDEVIALELERGIEAGELQGRQEILDREHQLREPLREALAQRGRREWEAYDSEVIRLSGEEAVDEIQAYASTHGLSYFAAFKALHPEPPRLSRPPTYEGG